MEQMNFTDMLRAIQPGESKDFPVQPWELQSKRQLANRLKDDKEPMYFTTAYDREHEVMTVTRTTKKEG